MNENSHQSETKIQLFWKEEHYQIPPGSSKSIPLIVTNLGTNRSYFEISIKGVPREWVASDPPVVQLGPGGEGEIELTIQVPELPLSRAGRFPFSVQVINQEDPGITATLSGELTVAAFQSEGRIGVMMAVTQFVVAPGNLVTVPILLHNRGLTEDTFRLSVEGIPSAWIATEDAQTSLQPGEQREIEITMQPPRSPESVAGPAIPKWCHSCPRPKRRYPS